MRDIDGAELQVGDRVRIVANRDTVYRGEFPNAVGTIIRLSKVLEDDSYTADIKHRSGLHTLWLRKEVRKIVCFICNDTGHVQELQCPRCNR